MLRHGAAAIVILRTAWTHSFILYKSACVLLPCERCQNTTWLMFNLPHTWATWGSLSIQSALVRRYHPFSISAQSYIKSLLKLNYYRTHFLLYHCNNHPKQSKLFAVLPAQVLEKKLARKNYTHTQQTELSSIQNEAQLLTNIIKLWSILSQDGRCLAFGSGANHVRWFPDVICA